MTKKYLLINYQTEIVLEKKPSKFRVKNYEDNLERFGKQFTDDYYKWIEPSDLKEYHKIERQIKSLNKRSQSVLKKIFDRKEQEE